jgi:hypothetical protein
LPIADCRLTIEKVVWQLLPMSIIPPRRGNRQSKIGNSSRLFATLRSVHPQAHALHGPYAGALKYAP